MQTRAHTERFSTGVLVIGAGAAGLRASIELAERGLPVLCLTRRARDDAHTVLAAGGINAALGTTDPQDSWEQHAADTLREGYWLNDPAAVEILATQAPRAIAELAGWGADFARDEHGELQVNLTYSRGGEIDRTPIADAPHAIMAHARDTPELGTAGRFLE